LPPMSGPTASTWARLPKGSPTFSSAPDRGSADVSVKAVEISGSFWGLRPSLCGKALPFRPKSPKCYCLPPREGCAFTRRKTGCIKSAIGKAQPFPSTDGRSRRSYPIPRIVICTSLRCPSARRWPGLETDGLLCGSFRWLADDHAQPHYSSFGKPNSPP